MVFTHSLFLYQKTCAEIPYARTFQEVIYALRHFYIFDQVNAWSVSRITLDKA